MCKNILISLWLLLKINNFRALHNASTFLNGEFKMLRASGGVLFKWILMKTGILGDHYIDIPV
jgi:hypothetical protein